MDAVQTTDEAIREEDVFLAAGDDLGDVFDRVSALMYDISGVNLTEGKKELVRARLNKRLRALGWVSFRQYLSFVESEGGREELARMVDVLTTNKTSFFRELPHFEFLRDQVLPAFQDGQRPLRIWSAGCSSGEEPYSLAIFIRQFIKDADRLDIRILGTDLSRRVLACEHPGGQQPDQRAEKTTAARGKRDCF